MTCLLSQISALAFCLPYCLLCVHSYPTNVVFEPGSFGIEYVQTTTELTNRDPSVVDGVTGPR